MTTVEAIRAKLVADATVSGLVGTRIYPQLMPQGATLPAVVLTVIDSIPANSFTGSADTRLDVARVQVDAYATTYLAAHQVASAVNAVVANLSFEDLSAVRESTRDLYEDETGLHRVSSDYSVSR